MLLNTIKTFRSETHLRISFTCLLAKAGKLSFVWMIEGVSKVKKVIVYLEFNNTKNEYTDENILGELCANYIII